MTASNKIQQIDYWLIQKINGQWHTPSLDSFFLIMREAATWIPLYIFILLFVVINFKKKGWIWCATLAATIITSNFISSNLIKENFMRLRPCRDPALFDAVRSLANYCPSSSSFTSSHATNHFAIAMFIYLSIDKSISKYTAVLFLWAALISYAQVYVGVHFVTDVMAGGVTGIIIGYFAANIYKKYAGNLTAV